jgi:predicted enzyme related to lactoylglutathione lyase
MPNNVVHFDVAADDLDRARHFYEAVFGWRFRAWGPPDFFLITTGEGDDLGIHGGLTKRREPLGPGSGRGFECTIAVEDLEAARAAIERHGGRILLEPMEIPTVGRLVQFEDTEGNVVCAMQYEAAFRHPGLD